MDKNFNRLNAFTLAEGGRSPLLYGDEGVAEGYSCAGCDRLRRIYLQCA